MLKPNTNLFNYRLNVNQHPDSRVPDEGRISQAEEKQKETEKREKEAKEFTEAFKKKTELVETAMDKEYGKLTFKNKYSKEYAGIKADVATACQGFYNENHDKDHTNWEKDFEKALKESAAKLKELQETDATFKSVHVKLENLYKSEKDDIYRNARAEADPNLVSDKELNALIRAYMIRWQAGFYTEIDKADKNQLKEIDKNFNSLRFTSETKVIQDNVLAAVRIWNKGKDSFRSVYKDKDWENKKETVKFPDSYADVEGKSSFEEVKLPDFSKDPDYKYEPDFKLNEYVNVKNILPARELSRTIMTEMLKQYGAYMNMDIDQKGPAAQLTVEEMVDRLEKLLPGAKDRLTKAAQNAGVKGEYSVNNLFSDWNPSNEQDKFVPIIQEEIKIYAEATAKLGERAKEEDLDNLKTIEDPSTKIENLKISKAAGSNKMKLEIAAKDKNGKEIKFAKEVDLTKGEPYTFNMALGTTELDAAMKKISGEAVILSQVIPPPSLYERIKSIPGVDGLVDQLKPELTVKGFASMEGDYTYNKKLALDRANAIKARIEAQYPGKLKIKPEGVVWGVNNKEVTKDGLENEWKSYLKQWNDKFPKAPCKDVDALKAVINNYDSKKLKDAEQVAFLDSYLKNSRSANINVVNITDKAVNIDYPNRAVV